MSSAARRARVEQALRDILAEMVAREVKDPRVTAAGLVSVTRVECNEDLSTARVYVSIYGKDDVAARAIAGLNAAAGFLRGPAGRKLNLSRPPELKFVRDVTAGMAQTLAEVMREDRAKAKAAGRDLDAAAGAAGAAGAGAGAGAGGAGPAAGGAADADDVADHDAADADDDDDGEDDGGAEDDDFADAERTAELEAAREEVTRVDRGAGARPATAGHDGFDAEPTRELAAADREPTADHRPATAGAPAMEPDSEDEP